MLQSNGYICARETRWHFFFIFALLPAVLVLNSCGSSTTAATPAISMTCANTSLNADAQTQCTATISNLTSTVATWQVNSVSGGNSTVGTIDTNGLYTAPATVPTTNNGIVTVTAIAQAQTSLTATATITILPPAVISAITCVNSSTGQATKTASPDQSLVCTPTVAGGGNIAVNWFVNNSASCSSTLGVPNGNVNIGLVRTSGNQMNFSAPQIPPPGGAIAITAVSQADATQTLCVALTLTFGTASLQGAYAFSTTGRVVSGNAFRGRAGSFTANGSGQIIGGIEDINPQPGNISQSPISFSGAYSIGPDGRGTMSFCEGSASNSCPTNGQTSQFRVVVISSQQAQIIEFSPPNSSTALTAGSGEIDLQADASSFNTASLNGTYIFSFAGLSSATAQSAVGEFSANGANGVTGGELDVNVGGILSTQTILGTSSYSISSNGRGTATINTSGGTFKFAIYMVSANRAKFVETDASPILVGDAFKQQSIVSWGVSSLNGPYVFQTAGIGTGGEVTDLGSFTSNGNGSVAAGSAMVDDNNAGTVTSLSSLPASYTFDLAGNGRGTLTVGAHTYVFYMISTGQALIQETTSGIVAHGSMLQPQGGPFTLASLKTSFALSLTGTNGSGNEEDFVGQLTSTGAGTVNSGLLDVNSFGVAQTSVSNIGTYTTITANGRTTMQLTQPQNLVLYFVSPTQIFAMVGADSNRTVASGSLFQQF